ncbi:hypothetical protein Tco_0324220 [Tanacetum coccineum]
MRAVILIMENVIPLDHVDDVPVVEPNQPDAIPVILEPVLVDEDEDPEKEEFEEEEELSNPPPPASDSEPKDVIEIEDTIEPGDETVPASVHEVGESSTAPFLREDSDGLFPGLMRRDINSLFGRMTSLSRRLCGRETAHALVEKKGKAKDETGCIENPVRKLGNAEENVECKKLKKELEEARFSNTLLRMHNERVERDLYWTRVRAHDIYREMIRRGFMFEERPNEVIDVPVEDEESSSSEIMPPKFASLTQAGVRRMIKESADTAIAAEWVRHANAGNNASGSRQARGQVTAIVVRECTFAGFMKCNPDTFCGTERAVELRRWFEKTEMTFGISECAKDKKVKFAAATLRGPAFTWWNSKVTILGLDVANQMGGLC